MKKILSLSVFLLLAVVSMAQVEKIKDTPIYIGEDLVVVGVNANTTDEELLDIRLKILKHTSIRFTEFDVIRERGSKKKQGKIQFISMEVDCRDGHQGKISHSFEKGDVSVFGFYRDFEKNDFRKSFFIGNLSEETINNNKQRGIE